MGELQTRMHTEFRVDVAEMKLDRLDADAHFGGDLAGFQSRGRQAGNREFLSGQSNRIVFVLLGIDQPAAFEFAGAALDVRMSPEGGESVRGRIQVPGGVPASAPPPQSLTDGEFDQRLVEGEVEVPEQV